VVLFKFILWTNREKKLGERREDAVIYGVGEWVRSKQDDSKAIVGLTQIMYFLYNSCPSRKICLIIGLPPKRGSSTLF
jgi:hypothetical protein